MSEQDFSDDEMPALEEIEDDRAPLDIMNLDFFEAEVGKEPNLDLCQKAKAKANEKAREGNYEAAIIEISDAIFWNPSSALLLATRASFCLKLDFPHAALKDCKVALARQPNATCAKLYRVKGDAEHVLQRTDDAIVSWRQAQQIDYDPDLAKTVKDAIAEQNITKKAKAKEDEDMLKADPEKLYQTGPDLNLDEEGPFSTSAFANLASNAKKPDAGFMAKLMSNPRLMELLMKNPKVGDMLAEAGKGPEGAAKYKDDPLFKEVILAVLGEAAKK